MVTGADRFFLCFGLPKSGTTFLQRVLGMHPEISCPSEQSFPSIFGNIRTFTGAYNNALQVIDRRTGGQGAPKVDGAIAQAIFRDTVLNLSRGFARGKRVHGLNDNSVFFNLRLFDDLFDHPPMICIFRNPVDRAISLWRHNRRLAEEEKELREEHLKLLDNPEGTLEGFITMQVDGFAKTVERYCAFADGRANVLTVRYESLVKDKLAELKRLYAFLGVDAPEALLASIAAGSSREAMAENSTHPAFFGLDNGDEEDTPLPDAAFRADALKACAAPLARLGYPPA